MKALAAELGKAFERWKRLRGAHLTGEESP